MTPTPADPGTDRPRERLSALGPSYLSDADLVTLLVSPGTRAEPGDVLARRILATCGTLQGLGTRRPGELAAIPGLGSAKASRLVAAIELGRRVRDPGPATEIVHSAADVLRRCGRIAEDPDEVFAAISVNSRNRVLGEWVVARGWESGVNLTPRQVFTLLVKEQAGRVILVHNHPSGDPTPSPEDVRFTGRLLDAARCLEIRILDHVVVARGGHASLREYAGSQLAFG